MTLGCGGLISAVEPGSVGAEIGLEPGDRLMAINDHPLRDVIDYRYYGAEERLWLDVERDGARHRLEVERDYDESLGLTFDAAVRRPARVRQPLSPFALWHRCARCVAPCMCATTTIASRS